MPARGKPADEANVVGRMQLALGVRTLQQLADFLGAPVATVKSWKQRNSARKDALLAVANASGARVEWLVVGPPELRHAPKSTQINHAHVSYERDAEGAKDGQKDASALRDGDNERHYYRFDGNLFVRAMEAIESELDRRRIELSAERRVRLYRALYDFSADSGVINEAAVGSLIDVLTGTTRQGRG